MKGRRTRRTGTRDRLLFVGISLFASKGYAATSVREIADRAGVTKPVLYYYFGSKEGFFRAILEWADQQHQEILEGVIHTPGTVPERLSCLYRVIYERLMEHYDLFRLFNRLFLGFSDSAPPHDLGIFRKRMMDAIRTLYLSGVEQGELRPEDVDDVVLLIYSVMDYGFRVDDIKEHPLEPPRVARLFELLISGLAPTKGGSP